MSNIKLAVNGQTFEGWKDATIKFSMKTIAGSFSLAVVSKWAELQTPWQVTPGDDCTLSIDGEQVITGYVDDANPSITPTDSGIEISGRDMAGDLVDCSAEANRGSVSNVTLLTLCKKICAPFGIGVTVADNAGDISLAFPNFIVNGSETAFEAMNKAAKLRGVLLTNDGQGNVVICRAGTDHSSTALVEGKNIQTGRGRYSFKDRFSTYKVKSQGFDLQDVGDTGGYSLNPSYTATDDFVDRYRPLIILAEGAADLRVCTLRAKWEAAVRIGKSKSVSITVVGWRDSDGDLWTPNQLVTVNSPTLGVNEELLLTDVTLRKSDSGEMAELTLEPAAAYNPDPTLVNKKDPFRQLVLQESGRKP